MNKILKLCVIFTLILCLLAGCSHRGGGQKSEEASSPKLTIVTTIFPIYDWITSILGEAHDISVTMLLDDGVDLHSFQPSASDILTISTCDLFIFVGGESDEWVEDALQEAVNPNMIVLNLLDTLGDLAKEEEMVEGMQEEEHDHGESDHDESDHDEDHDHEHEEGELDEHVWLSLRNAQVLVKAMADALLKLDAVDEATLQAELDEYLEKLDSLDKAYEKAVSEGSKDTLLFADRFPFRYLMDDYGLSYYAAFAGCSAETEASFETIAFLSQKVDELGLGAVVAIEDSDGKIAETVIQNTKDKNQKLLKMDSMQSITKKDREEGASYLSIMEKNLEVLSEALQ